LRGLLPWGRALYMSGVVVEDVVSARWIWKMLSRDKGGWQSGVDASGRYDVKRR